MADRTTDERLREIATSDPLVLAISAQMGEPSWADVRAIAAELLAARAEVAAVEAAICDRGVSERDCSLPLAKRVDNLIVDLRTWSLSYAQTVMENERLRAEVERLRGLIREYVQATDGLAVEDSAEAQNRYERAEDALREVARG